MSVETKRPASRWAREWAALFPLVQSRGEEAALAQFLDEVRAELLQQPRRRPRVKSIHKGIYGKNRESK